MSSIFSADGQVADTSEQDKANLIDLHRGRLFQWLQPAVLAA